MASTPLYLCYRRLLPASAVQHAVCLSFTSPLQTDFVVAKSCLLEVYTVREEQGLPLLELSGSFPLEGNVAEMLPLRAPPPLQGEKTSTDWLLLVFPEARAVVVRYDSTFGRLETVSMHNFEANSAGPGSTSFGLDCAPATPAPPLVAVDSSERCVAILAHGNKLVVLPLGLHRAQQAVDLPADQRAHARTYWGDPDVVPRSAALAADPSSAGGGIAAAAPDALGDTFVVDLAACGLARAGPTSIRALAFLEGYSEPTLAILQEVRPTCPSRLAAHHGDCEVVALSLSLVHRRHPVMWRVRPLPHDCSQLCPVPAPIKGVLALSSNTIIHIGQKSQTHVTALALNGFAIATYGAVRQAQPSTGAKLDVVVCTLPGGLPPLQPNPATQAFALEGARIAFVDRSTALLTVSSGKAYLLHLEHAPSQCERLKMSAWPVGEVGARPTSLAVCRSRGLVFVASTGGDSLLIRIHLSPPSDVIPDEPPSSSGAKRKMNADEAGQLPLTKKSKDNEADADEATMLPIKEESESVSMEDEEEFLYGPAAASALNLHTSARHTRPLKHRTKLKSVLEVCDSLTCLGALTNGAFGEVFEGPDGPFFEQTETDNAAEAQRNFRAGHLVTASGVGLRGGLGIFTPGIIPQPIGKVSIPGCESVWWLGKDEHTFILGACPSKCRTIILRLVISQNSSSPHTFEEVPDDDETNPFLPGVQTVVCGMMASGSLCLQVYTEGIRVVREGQPSQDLLLLDDIDTGGLQGGYEATITGGYFSTNKAVIQLSDGSLRFLSIDEEDLDVLACLPDCNYPQEVSAFTVFQAKEGLFLQEDIEQQESTKVKYQISRLTTGIQTVEAEDGLEEDTFLYSCASDKAIDSWDDSFKRNEKDDNSTDPSCAGMEYDAYGFYESYCALINGKGDLQIFSIGTGEAVFRHRGTSFGPPVLVNMPQQQALHPPEWYVALDDKTRDIIYSKVQNLTTSPADSNEKALMNDISEEQLAELIQFFDEEQRVMEKESSFNAGVEAPKVCELACSVIGSTQIPSWGRRVCLVLLLEEGAILVYVGRFEKEKLACFVKVEHQFLSHRISTMGLVLQSHLFQFQDLGGHSGVAVTGWRAATVLCQRGQPGVYALHTAAVCDRAASEAPAPTSTSTPTTLLSFSPVNHEDVGNGCLLLFQNGDLVLCSGRGAIQFDVGGQSGFMGFKVPLDRMVHKVCYIGHSKDPLLAKILTTPTYVVLSSCRKPFDEVLKEFETAKAAKELEKQQQQQQQPPLPPEEDEFEEDDVVSDWVEPDAKYGGAPEMTTDSFRIEIISSNGWKTLSSFELEPFEHGLSMAVLNLGQEKKNVIVAGTGTTPPEGEDALCTGRLLIFEVDLARYMDPLIKEKVLQVPKLKLALRTKEQKGPVSAVASVGSNLVVAVGPKLMVYSWNAERDREPTIKPIAFWDAQVYVVTMTTVKNFILVGDYCKNIAFLQWDEKKHQLHLLAKAYKPGRIMGASFVIDAPSLGMLATDYDRNVQLYQYNKAAVEARGGNKLLCKADFHLGSHVTFFLQHKVNTSIMFSRQTKKRQTRQSLLFGTVDGGVETFVPVDERVFRRLYALQGVMINAVQHNAALNPRAFRLLVANGYHEGRKKNIINGALVWRFISLDSRFQHRLASAIGTKVGIIINNLLEIELSTPLGFYSH